ncbi:helix-turn-helix domain-containing protein [uncultured Limosilactobacillus sp.]|uniref:helix-turn-helix domain-containing protein n=1 Tax=uncultured Limosilactobacillus sp. TaxID=2837629 RepID=UPI002600FF0C|nr:helix-turn-helix domain-containing protein [uncultured Limosilactobacillus sp.]
MPSKTFINLSEKKQLNMQSALLKEFSEHPLATAQVARIVKTAGVARGTFYKYFSDLIDAHQWLMKVTISDLGLHPDDLMQQRKTAGEYEKAICEMLNRVRQSSYASFLKNYYQANEGYLAARGINHHSVAEKMDAKQWAIATLCHQAIKECLMNPALQKEIIKRLGTVLKRLIGG